MATSKQNLAIGMNNFSLMIKEKFTYVDKSMFAQAITDTEIFRLGAQCDLKIPNAEVHIINWYCF